MHILRTPLAAVASVLVAAGVVLAPSAGALASPGADLGADPGASSTVGSSAVTPSPRTSVRLAHPAAAQQGTTSVSVTPSGTGVVRPGEDLQLSVTVTNDTDTELAAGRADLDVIRTRIDQRDELSDWISDTSSDGYLGYRMQRVDVPAVPAHHSVTVGSITVPAADLGLDPDRNPLGARRISAAYRSGDTSAVGRSAVTWLPPGSSQSVSTSVAMPITVPATQDGLLSAQTLAAETSLGGTLTAQLDAAEDHNVAIGIDPRIIASIRVLGVDAPSSATAWLDRLERSGNETFALAWADADTVGLRQAGSNGILAPVSLDQAVNPDRFPGAATPTPTPTDDQTATDGPTAPAAPGPTATDGAGTDASGATGTDSTGTDTTGQEPGTQGQDGGQGGGSTAEELPTTKTLLDFPYTLTNVSWPVDDTVNTDDLVALHEADVQHTILASGNTSLGSDTAAAASQKIGDDDVLVGDQTASALLRQAATAGDDRTWSTAMARLTATLVTSAVQQGAPTAPMLMTLGREWPTDDTRIAETLEAVDTLPWVAPADLSTAAAATPGTVELTNAADDASRLDQLRRLVDAERQVADFSTAVAEPQAVTAPNRLDVLAAASNAWRTDAEGFARAVGKQESAAAEVASSVAIVKPSDLTLLSDRSSLPIQVSNKSAFPVTVYLTVQPSNSFLQIDRNALPVEIAADSSTRITFPVQSVANGKTQLVLSLTSGTGVQVAAPTAVELNVQAQWESIITGVAGAAVVAVFGLGIVRNVRRRIRRRRGEDVDDEPDPNRPLETAPVSDTADGHQPGPTPPVPDRRASGEQAVPVGRGTAQLTHVGAAPAEVASGASGNTAVADTGVATSAHGDRLEDALARAGAMPAPRPSDTDRPANAGPTTAPTSAATAQESTISTTQPEPAVDAEPVAERNLGRASAMLAAGTMVSRVLGFVKVIVLAYAIGQNASLSANAFAIANQLPNNIYALIAGGLLSAVLIPQIVRSMQQHTDGGTAYVNKIVTLGGTVFVVITLIATIAAPLLVRAYAAQSTSGKGMSPAAIDLAILFAFWCLPQILFYAMYSLLGEVLNARQVFGPFTWAPLLNNVIAVAGLVVFIALFGGREVNTPVDAWDPLKIAVLAGSATLGVVAQALFLPFFWRRAGLTFRPDFRWRGVGLKATGTAAGWLFAMILVTQIAGLVQSRVTSLGSEGAGNAVLQNAWLLFMLPHSIITVSIATAYFTRMSHDAERGDLGAVQRNLSLSLRIVGLFTVFATIALMVVSVPFGRVFENTFDGALSVGAVLLAYMPGLVLFSMLFIIQRVFWAMHDHRTPFLMQCIQSVLFVIGALAVTVLPRDRIGIGVAACTTIAGSAQTIVALVLVRRKLGGMEGPNVWRSHLQFLVAAVVAGGVGVAVVSFFGAFSASGFAMADATGALITLVLTGAVMALVYFGVLVLIRNQEIRGAVDILKARLGR